MSDPKKEFRCSECGCILNDTRREWGKDTPCPNCREANMRYNPANVKKTILEQAKKNKIVYMTSEGLMVADLDDFLKQPAEGILYDLNRDRVTVLSFLDNPKWVNDLAVGQVITRLKEYVDGGKG